MIISRITRYKLDSCTVLRIITIVIACVVCIV